MRQNEDQCYGRMYKVCLKELHMTAFKFENMSITRTCSNIYEAKKQVVAEQFAVASWD